MQVECRFLDWAVLKAGPLNPEQVVRVISNIDRALYGSGMSSSFRSPSNNARPQLINIGNTERKGNYRIKSSRDTSSKHGNGSQRQTDSASNDCFVRHKKGRRAWKL